MNSNMGKTIRLWIRIYRGLGCARVMLIGCLLVTFRAMIGKSNRQYTTQLMRKGALKILRGLKTDFKIVRSENYALDPNLPRIYMSNHLSLFDTILFVSTIDDTIRTVTKKELLKAPLFGKTILYSEQAIVDRQARF